jgi:energy-converting hydrogenase Eha subunit A
MHLSPVLSALIKSLIVGFGLGLWIIRFSSDSRDSFDRLIPRILEPIMVVLLEVMANIIRGV